MLGLRVAVGDPRVLASGECPLHKEHKAPSNGSERVNAQHCGNFNGVERSGPSRKLISCGKVFKDERV